MMPELGKRLVHEEGLALIREWIAAMADPGKPGTAAPAGRPRARATTSGRRLHIGSRTRTPGARSTEIASPPSLEKTLERTGRSNVVVVAGRLPSEFERSGPSFRSSAIMSSPCATPRREYVWQASQDGMTWEDLKETATDDERHTFRIHRLEQSRRVRSLRIAISSAEGEASRHPRGRVLRRPATEIAFPPWAVVVSTTGSTRRAR